MVSAPLDFTLEGIVTSAASVKRKQHDMWDFYYKKLYSVIFDSDFTIYKA